MTIASWLRFDVIEIHHKKKEVANHTYEEKPDFAEEADTHMEDLYNEGEPQTIKDKGKIYQKEEDSHDESEEEQYTDTDYEDEEMTSFEEEYMDKVEALIRIIERLEELKR